MAEETTKQAPNGQEHIESIFCRGAGCMIGVVIVLVAVPAGILMGSLAICWWCQRKRWVINPPTAPASFKGSWQTQSIPSQAAVQQQVSDWSKNSVEASATLTAASAALTGLLFSESPLGEPTWTGASVCSNWACLDKSSLCEQQAEAKQSQDEKEWRVVLL